MHFLLLPPTQFPHFDSTPRACYRVTTDERRFKSYSSTCATYCLHGVAMVASSTSNRGRRPNTWYGSRTLPLFSPFRQNTLHCTMYTGVCKSLECAGAWRGKSVIFDSESLSVLCDTDKAVQFWNAWREGIRVALGTPVALN